MYFNIISKNIYDLEHYLDLQNVSEYSLILFCSFILLLLQNILINSFGKLLKIYKKAYVGEWKNAYHNVCTKWHRIEFR